MAPSYYHPLTQRTFNSTDDVRRAFAHVVFEGAISREALEYIGVFPMVYEKPEAQGEVEAFPLAVSMVEGVWTQLWDMRIPTAQELAQRKLDRKALVPHQITRAQGILALRLTAVPGTEDSYLSRVDPAIGAIPDPLQRDLARIEWLERPTFERNSTMVSTIGALIGLDEDGLDDLFILAGGL